MKHFVVPPLSSLAVYLLESSGTPYNARIYRLVFERPRSLGRLFGIQSARNTILTFLSEHCANGHRCLGHVESGDGFIGEQVSLYSGRMRLPMLNELMGWDFNPGFMNYGAIIDGSCMAVINSAVTQAGPAGHPILPQEGPLTGFLAKPHIQ
ncbi:hypothetical protein FA13DRAFT_1716175 [Coprinellus micaceus]|uniref:Uncharacterized protein n=1 Tax=Coprinellus micaceus TaxID=71717 RepID=A0A4Y7SKK8_COPMI|nr:hypothetical protein FA13DRAFT_1716175 [Coprinellus micaceus]